MSNSETIAAIIAGVKGATEFAKALREGKLTQAETKLKVAELINSLADTKIAAAELQDAIGEKDKEIARLKEALEIKGNVVKRGDGYYFPDANGQPHGDAFCVHCWESDHVLLHIARTAKDSTWYCPNCKNTYRG